MIGMSRHGRSQGPGIQTVATSGSWNNITSATELRIYTSPAGLILKDTTWQVTIDGSADPELNQLFFLLSWQLDPTPTDSATYWYKKDGGILGGLLSFSNQTITFTNNTGSDQRLYWYIGPTGSACQSVTYNFTGSVERSA